MIFQEPKINFFSSLQEGLRIYRDLKVYYTCMYAYSAKKNVNTAHIRTCTVQREKRVKCTCMFACSAKKNVYTVHVRTRTVPRKTCVLCTYVHG
jgi:hypothetical protein